MAVQWGRIRQGYMSGKSYKELAEKYKISVKTIQNRASKEGWVKDKGKIKEEVGKKIVERVVRVRVEELGENLMQLALDKAGTMKNIESLAKAIQTAVQTQRDLYKLPTLDQDYRKKEAAQRKREAKEKLALDKERLEIEKQKAAGDDKGNDQELWQIVAPDGTVVDG